MSLYYISIIIAIISTVMYHVFQNSISSSANPVISLIATYITALVLSGILYFVYPRETSIGESFKELNWASYGLGFAIVTLEVAFLLVYRTGWNIAVAALLVNVVAAILLVLLGYVLYSEKITLINFLGIIISVIGIILINYEG